jgi:hypothetical protein
MTGKQGPRKQQASRQTGQGSNPRSQRTQEDIRRALQSMLDKRLNQLRSPVLQRSLTQIKSGRRDYDFASQRLPWTLRHGAANRTDLHVSRRVYSVYDLDTPTHVMQDRTVSAAKDFNDSQWSKTSVLVYHSYPHCRAITDPAVAPVVLAEGGPIASGAPASLALVSPQNNKPDDLILYSEGTIQANRATRDPDVRWSQRILTSHLRVTITGGHSLRGIFSWQPAVADWSTLAVREVPARISAEVHTVHRTHFAGNRTVINIPLFLRDPSLYGRMSRVGPSDESKTDRTELENVDPWGTICAIFEELAWASTDPPPRIEVVCTEKIQSELPSSDDHLDNSATHATIPPERAPPVTKDRVRPPKQTPEKGPRLRGGPK